LIKDFLTISTPSAIGSPLNLVIRSAGVFIQMILQLDFRVVLHYSCGKKNLEVIFYFVDLGITLKGRYVPGLAIRSASIPPCSIESGSCVATHSTALMQRQVLVLMKLLNHL